MMDPFLTNELYTQELLYVMRHLTGTPHRRAFLPEFEKLMSERVLFGGSVGNQELLRCVF